LGEKEQIAAHVSQTLSNWTGRRRLTVLASGNMASKDSAHDVFFVQAEPDGKPGTPRYACKRFRKPENAQRELQAIEMAKARGFRTLEPAAVPIQSVAGIGDVLVTRQMTRFTTMNQLGWGDNYAGDVTYESRIAEPLRSASRFVANMHRHGITHGDLQLKNIGQIPPGRFVLFDLEGAEFVDPQTVPNDLAFQDKASADVQTLVISLVDRGYMWGSSDRMFAEEVTRNVFDPYLEVCSSEDPAMLDRFMGIIDEAQLERQMVHQKLSQQAIQQTVSV
jgi:tRNA A-37 threonylcarbamoyl transferase component Bud32